MKKRKFLLIIAGISMILSCAENLENKVTELEVIEEMSIKETKAAPTVETAFEFVKSSGGIDEYRCTLNDLSILLMEDHSAPVATPDIHDGRAASPRCPP